MVLAPGMHAGPLPAASLAAEQRLEEVAVVRAIAGAEIAPAELEAGIPARRRLEVLPGLPLAAHLIVGGALLGILQHLVGLAQLLEARLGIGLLADVRMVLARQLAVGALDLVLRRAARQSEGLVVVLEFHGSIPLTPLR